MEREDYPKTFADLAKAVGVSKSCVYQWKQKGLEELRGEDGRFDPGEVRIWIKTKKKQRMAKNRPPMEIKEDNQQRLRVEKVEASRGGGVQTTSPDLDLEEEKDWSNEYRKARAIRENLTVKQLQEELINRKDVEEMFAARAREVRQTVLSLGRRLAPRLVGMNAREIESEINQETRRICLSYSREVPTS
tara:strand:+ start:19 stop:588 length:570 start_codon:yes stop_codon:yes gene_type:complete